MPRSRCPWIGRGDCSSSATIPPATRDGRSVRLPSDGKEAIDRKSIDLEQEELVKQVYAVNPRTVVVLVSSFPFAIKWTEETRARHSAHDAQRAGGRHRHG